MIWKWLIQNIAKVNLKMYLFFLIITSIIWLMMKLSDQYNKTLDIPLNFIEVKEGYMVINHPISSLEIAVSAEGFKMLSFATGNNDPISVSLDKINLKTLSSGFLRGSIATKSLKKAISNQLGVKMSGKNIRPDSIIFILDKIDTVNIPVKLNQKIEVVSGFRLYGSPQIQPDFVNIIGPKHITDTISFISTMPLILKDISAPFEHEIALMSIDKSLKSNTKKVKIKADVVEFIEAETKVPITVYSKVPGLKIKTFPKEIVIKYQVAMPDYNSISDSLFIISVEIDSLTALRNKSLIPKIIKIPDYVEDARLSTNKVDFIILDK